MVHNILRKKNLEFCKHNVQFAQSDKNINICCQDQSS